MILRQAWEGTRARLPPNVVVHGIKLFWLFADQGVFALSNFLLNILFARWLPQSHYGIYALTFSGYLVLTLLHYGMILEPLLVQSGKVEARCRRSYIMTVIKAHLLVNLGVLSVALLAMCCLFLLNLPTAALGVIGAGGGGILMLMLLTARRLCLKFLNTKVSALIGVIYLIGVITSAYMLYADNMVTWLAIWLILGGWALVCSIVIFTLLYRATDGNDPYSLRTLYEFQMQYAYFATAAASAQWLRFDGVMVLLASLVGIQQVAETRAMYSILNPFSQINIALNTSWLVQSSEADLHNRRLPVWQVVISYGGLLMALAGLMVWWKHDLVQLVYGGRYVDAAWQLPYLMITVSCAGVECILTGNLKGRGHVWRGYTSPVVGAIVAMLLAWFLMPEFGVTGGVVAIVGSFVSGALASILVFR
jgi:O-antigen/teichoic acid export membrane protein